MEVLKSKIQMNTASCGRDTMWQSVKAEAIIDLENLTYGVKQKGKKIKTCIHSSTLLSKVSIWTTYR